MFKVSFIFLGTQAYMNRDRLVSTGNGLDHLGVGVRFFAGETDFFLLHNDEAGFGVIPTSYKMDTGACFLGVRM
jgi:hypothetical protein